MNLLTNLRAGTERLDMHDVTDSSSDNDHLPAVSLAYPYNATQAPVSIICIAFREQEQQSITSGISSFITYWHLLLI